MKGKLFLSLFALPFVAIGAWMLVSISSLCVDAWQMQSWQPVQAELDSAGYTSHAGDDSTTYEAYANYQYTFGEQRFSGNRVQLSTGADNIGEYQRRTGDRLHASASQGKPVTVFVNPAAPAESIIDRGIRWGLLGFKAVFLLVFGGFGLGMLVFAIRAPRKVDASLPEFVATPWRLNPDWHSATITSNSRVAMWGVWAFAAIWCLISAPLPFVAWNEVVEKQNYLALAALLFPLVGVGLVGWAVKQTREWRVFGRTPVTLDPFPGSIGGHVGGVIETRHHFDSSQAVVVTLSNVHSYTTGSGKNRRRAENNLWQDQVVAHCEAGPQGTRLVFRFDVPDDLHPSDAAPAGDSHYLWRLHLAAELPGTNLERDFLIPVYATAESSARIPAARSGAAAHLQQAVFAQVRRKRVRIRNDGSGKTLQFPMGQALVSNLAAILIGGTFAGAGWFLVVQEHKPVFGSIFGGTGALIALAAFYMLFKSLEVTHSGDSIHSVRRWLGIPLGRKLLRRHEFSHFKKSSNMQTQAGNRSLRNYRISGVDQAGREVVLGEGFIGELEVKAGIRMLTQELGLQPRAESITKREPGLEPRFSVNKELFTQRSRLGER